VNPLELRELKLSLDGRSLGAKISAVKCVAEMVRQEYVTRFAIPAAEATNTPAIFGGLHESRRQ
jgi:hypothetical protein